MIQIPSPTSPFSPPRKTFFFFSFFHFRVQGFCWSIFDGEVDFIGDKDGDRDGRERDLDLRYFLGGEGEGFV